MMQWWDRIPIVPGKDIIDMLREWFHREPVHGDYLSGDWDMGAKFDDNVRCVVMDSNSGIAQVDCRIISPIRNTYFLFYSLERGHLVIWGGLTCQELLAMKPAGVVRRDEDLLWQPSSKTRCRSLAVPPMDDDDEDDDEFDKTNWRNSWFQFPLPLCVTGAATAECLTAEVFEVALCRLEWYYADDDDYETPFPIGWLEQGSFLLCATLVHTLSNKYVALAYQLHRMTRERQLFDQRIAPFLESEKAMLSLLKHNGAFWSLYILPRIVSPDPEDEQAFFRCCYGLSAAATIPIIWIRIPLWEAPFMHVATEFPLHEGGVIYMPCYPPWVAKWIWESHVLPEAQRNFSDSKLIKDAPEPFGYFFEHTALYLEMLQERRRSSIEKKKKKEKNRRFTGDSGGTKPLIQDIEDIFRSAPPCVTFLLKQKRFPLNMERLDLTRIFMGAGVQVSTMTLLYERLNLQHPRGDPQPLNKRFNVEVTIECLKDKDPIWCTTLIKKAISGKGEGMRCPLVQRSKVPARTDELAMAKFVYEIRQQCTACHAPTRPVHWKPWATPEHAMREGYQNIL